MSNDAYKMGDYAVCPGHGVGQVVDVEERVIGTEKKSFYIIKIIANGMTVMVPTSSETGIRPLVGVDQVERVFQLLKDHNVSVDNSTWNRRYREYMAKIKTGSLLEIADVLRALFLLKNQKNLSFGEKKMLDQCRELLAQEISLSQNQEKKSVATEIDSCFGDQA